MAPYSSTLAWKIPWPEEPGRLQSMGSLRVGQDWATSFSLFTFMHWRRKWQPTPVFLPGEFQGGGAWWAAIYGVAQSRTWLKRLSSSRAHLEMWKAEEDHGIWGAAKSLQSCLTLCSPTDGSPPGSSIPGILQARTLEWVAISFSNAWKWKVKMKSLSRVQLLVTPWTAASQAPLSMGFSRQDHWSGVPLPSPIIVL